MKNEAVVVLKQQLRGLKKQQQRVERAISLLGGAGVKKARDPRAEKTEKAEKKPRTKKSPVMAEAPSQD